MASTELVLQPVDLTLGPWCLGALALGALALGALALGALALGALALGALARKFAVWDFSGGAGPGALRILNPISILNLVLNPVQNQNLIPIWFLIRNRNVEVKM